MNFRTNYKSPSPFIAFDESESGRDGSVIASVSRDGLRFYLGSSWSTPDGRDVVNGPEVSLSDDAAVELYVFLGAWLESQEKRLDIAEHDR